MTVAQIAQEPDVERAVALFVDTLSRGYAVDEVRLYGSRARGDFRPDSDVDRGVVAVAARSRFQDIRVKPDALIRLGFFDANIRCILRA